MFVVSCSSHRNNKQDETFDPTQRILKQAMLLVELPLGYLEIEYPNKLGEAYFRSLLVGLGFEIEFIHKSE